VVTYPAPNLSVSTNGAGNVFVSFQSALGGTYTLYSAPAAALGTPVSSWTVVGSSIVGDGNVDQFPAQTISGAGTVYVVTVH
jgi:hypothetical protein